jgi:hypothetical protein
MGKRSCTSNPAMVELDYGEGFARPSSKRRALQVASNTAAMSLLALRTELPIALSQEAFPLTKPLLPLQPQRQAQSVCYSASSITDDEDENEKNQVVASKKRTEVFDAPRSLTQLALQKPTLSLAETGQREAPSHRNLPFGRPLQPAPKLPHLLMSRRVIPSTNKSWWYFSTAS